MKQVTPYPRVLWASQSNRRHGFCLGKMMWGRCGSRLRRSEIKHSVPALNYQLIKPGTFRCKPVQHSTPRTMLANGAENRSRSILRFAGLLFFCLFLRSRDAAVFSACLRCVYLLFFACSSILPRYICRWGYGETCALGHGNDADCSLPKKVDTKKRGVTKVCGVVFAFLAVARSFVRLFGRWISRRLLYE